MRKRLAALVVASFLVVPAAAEAALDTPVGASASQASTKTMKSALRKDIKRALKSVRKLDLATVASKGFKLKRIRALTAGKLSLTATVRSDSGRVTVTKGSRSFGKSGKKNVRVKLTRSGKQLLGATDRATLRLKATFAPRTGGRVTVVYRVTLKRSAWLASGLRAARCRRRRPPRGFRRTPRRCTRRTSTVPIRPWGRSHPSSAPPAPSRSGSENGDGYAHLTVLAGDPPPVAGDALERCELSHGGYDDAREPGEYWYHARIKLGPGFPHDGSNSLNWTTIQQWQEDGPAPGAPDRARDAALFVNSNRGPHERADVPPGAAPRAAHFAVRVFDYYQWHDFVVHGVWTDDPTEGFLEWSIDGVPVGRTNGVTSETGGRHFWKGGITRAPSVQTQQEAYITDSTSTGTSKVRPGRAPRGARPDLLLRRR